MRITHKFILTFAVALFALLSLATATYAWFTISQNAKVEQISMNVITKEGGIWISLDNENFNETVSWNDIKAYYKDVKKVDLQKYLKMNNVTTTDLNSFYNSYNSDIATENEDYLSFTLYFRTDDAEALGLYLSNDISDLYDFESVAASGTYVISKGIDFTADYEYDNSPTEHINVGDEKTYYAKDAFRIGIKELKGTNKNLEQKDERTEFKKFIWDISDDDANGRGYGYGNAQVEDPENPGETITKGLYGALGYLNSSKGTNILAPTGTALEKVNSLTIYDLSTFKSRFAQNNNSLCADFLKGTDGYYYAAIEVVMWIEGWDGDCMNGIVDDQIISQLYFRTGRPTE